MSLAPKVATPIAGEAPLLKRPSRIGWILAAIMVALIAAFVFLYFKTAYDATFRSDAAHHVEARTAPKQTSVAITKLSPGDIAAKYSDAVVVLESYNERGEKFSQGSGFIFSSDGKAFTNYHVIRGSSRMQARMHDQSTHDVEYIAGYDPTHDVAAIKIAGTGLPFVNLGDSLKVKTGAHVTVLGAPLGLESTLTDGIISAVREAGSFRIFQTSAPISHGSSGGPFFDDFGNVIGLAVATIQAGENLNFAVPIDSAKTMLANEGHTSFAELLSATEVRQAILTSSVSIPPQAIGLDVVVPEQGALLTGSFSISGGLRNDLGVTVTSTTGAVVWNGGVIERNANLNIPLRAGRYKLILNNKVGALWISPKTISGTVELTYYR
jgi:S1-C subfamily serine protease